MFGQELRTLVNVAESRWELPPLSCVTLMRVDPPGGWGAFGVSQVDRTLFTVSVAWHPPEGERSDDGLAEGNEASTGGEQEELVESRNV